SLAFIAVIGPVTVISVIGRDKRSSNAKQAIRRLRRILSYGQELALGRKRPSGKRSRTTFHLLRVPTISPGRPGDLAARALVQQWALAFLEATGRSGSLGPHDGSLWQLSKGCRSRTCGDPAVCITR